MSQSSSQVSRSRTAVLAITGIAAACGVYILYNTFSEQQPKSPLQRHNAVRRRPRHVERLESVLPLVGWSPDRSPLGSIRICRGQTMQIVNLAYEGVVPFEDLLEPLQGAENDAEWVHHLRISTIQGVLHAAVQPFLMSEADMRVLNAHRRRIHGHDQPTLSDYQLEWLPMLGRTIADRNVDEMREYAQRIQEALQSHVSIEEVLEAITVFSEAKHFGSNPPFTMDVRYFPSDDLTFASPADVESEGTLISVTDNLEDERNDAPSQGLKGLLYHIAEVDAKRKAYEHRGIHCEECGERPIRGVRWHCLNCPDFDLCSTCEANTEHQKTHVFVKIKIPLPVLSQPTNEYPLWYPGDPRKYHAPLTADLKKRLGEQYRFDAPQMDANYDQFTCIANVPWNNDPNQIMAAIDRRAFNKALTSERWPQRFRPNALYDRMFAFYDTNNDGLIGFEEFLSGLAYLRGPHRFTSLHRALQGFDIDGDGYLGRTDFLRLFRAKYEIQKLLINTMIETRENEQTQAAMDTLRSSLPISSIFSMEEIPPGEVRPRGGKEIDEATGDMRPLSGTKTILDDDEGWPDARAAGRRRNDWNGATVRPHERLQHHLSRFEEMLYSPTGDGDEGWEKDDDDDGADNSVHADGISREVTEADQISRDKIGVRRPSASNDGAADEPLNQNILCQIVEDGFHEMLDPLLKVKEDQDQEVINSREERKKWRKRVDEALEEREAFFERVLANTSPALPLATGAIATDHVHAETGSQGGSGGRSDLDGALVPTDTVSLGLREAEIAQRPLEDLLNATGYSVEDVDVQDSSESEDANDSIQEDSSEAITRDKSATETIESPHLQVDITRSESPPDPTMPQNRPNSTYSSRASSSEDKRESSKRDLAIENGRPRRRAISEERPPSQERLKYLALLDDQDREIQARGGPGKLSFDEIEGIVKADSTKELRGLVTSWLEWASF